jgi:hypothetical protein
LHTTPTHLVADGKPRLIRSTDVGDHLKGGELLLPDPVVKQVVAVVSATDESESPHGTFEVILSAPVVDRDGETLQPDEWQQPLPEHITFDIDHGMSVASTVGSGRPELDEEGNLRVRGSYASTELAQTTRALVTEGHVRTTSVAFLRKQDSKTGKPRRELLNGAFVAVPANPAALVLESKTAKDTPTRTRADGRTVQAIHDHAAALGASCIPQAGKDITPLREQLADTDTTTLPGPVRAVLAALGVLDPDPDNDDPKPPPAEQDTGPALRARRLRAISALHEIER